MRLQEKHAESWTFLPHRSSGDIRPRHTPPEAVSLERFGRRREASVSVARMSWIISIEPKVRGDQAKSLGCGHRGARQMRADRQILCHSWTFLRIGRWDGLIT
jgi:hypothetical protein